MKLGKAVQINIGVSDLRNSQTFYERLGFDLVDESSDPYPWARLTDGQNLVLLNQDGNLYIGLVYFSKDAPKRIVDLETNGIEFVQRREQDGQLFMAIFVGPGGLVVGLINYDPKGMPEPSGFPGSTCGTFGEFSVTVDDFASAADFWRNLGFELLHESDDPYPWGILSDSMMVIGLHQNKDFDDKLNFSGPAMTYFASDMADRVATLKNEGIIFEKEWAGDDGRINNATLQGPDGELIFLFQGEI